MTPKASPPSELLEPLQNFLQTFTQELTEQQFVPAFREEMRRVMSAVDNLQQSEESLQQIARGVERLREVFAPAGTRLLEGVKDLESLMRSNASDLRDRSGQVLKDLMNTHDQLEAALRNEAGVIQEQTAASREALTRTVADVESRLQTLTSTIETLCRKMEVEASDMVTVGPRRVESAASAPVTVSAPAVTVNIPDEVRELLVRTQTTLNAELERQRREFLDALQQSTQQNEERIARVDHNVERAVSSVAPRVQEELDQALLRLEERLQRRVVTVQPSAEGKPGKGQAQAQAAPDAMEGAISAAESRLVGEIASLRKSLRNDQEAIAKSTQDLTHDYEEATRKQLARVADETKHLSESLVALQKLNEALTEEERQSREQLVAVRAAIQELSTKGTDGQQGDASKQTLELLWSQSELLARKVDEDRHLLGQLNAAISRTEQAATTATDRAHSESRMLREKIDASLKELAERMQRDVVAETDRVQETLKKLALAWQTELGALREDIGKVTSEAATSLSANLKLVQTQLDDTRRTDQNAFRDLHAELTRSSTTLDDRVSALQKSSEEFSSQIQSHVKAVSSEVAKARTSQEQSLAVLKEAIRANYDESAVRLREIVEGGYDNFVKQIATIPQALERYASLIQSLHQGNHLALQSIASDTKNLLSNTGDKLEVLVADTSAIKKFFPLLDKKVERHTTELDNIRKGQAREDKDLADLKAGLAQANEKRDVQIREVKEEIRGFQHEATERFTTADQSLAEIKGELKTVQDQDLPAFRREFATLLTTKFDLMETTVRERQEALRAEIFNRMDQEKRYNLRVWVLLGLLALLSTAVQIGYHITNSGTPHP